MRYVVIGNGIGGVTAARELAKKAPPNSEIMIFSFENWGYYPRPKLPFFLENPKTTPDELIVYNKEWYESTNIDLHLNEKIHEIFPNKKEIVSSKGVYGYDRLLLSLGAECATPPIRGLQLKHSYTLRSLKDAVKIRNRLKNSRNVVIIGGGLLGIENACACAKQGLDVTIIEYFPQLLPNQLDKEGSDVLIHLLEEIGIRTVTNAQVEELIGDKEVSSVKIKDGTLFPADIVMTCTGNISRVELAEIAGLNVNRGIIVNNYLETSDPNIYAVGDVAEHNGRIYGIIAPATEQARVAAQNMIKPRSKEYHGSKISTTLKVADLYLTSIGYDKDLPQYKTMKYVRQDPWQYVKLFHEEDQLKSAIILGTKKGIPLIRKLLNQSLVENLEKLEDLFPGIKA